MKEINLIEKPPRKLEYLLQKTLLGIGERLAIILFILSIPVFLFFSNAPQAFSEEEKEVFIKQQENWYTQTSPQVPEETLETSYSYATATITPSPSPIPALIVKVDSSNGDVWERLAACESRGNWASDTGNGYYGGLQFNLSAWAGVGGQGKPSDASKEEQIMRGKMLQEKRGWGPWGACSKKLGLI